MPTNNDIKLLHPSLVKVYEEAKYNYHKNYPQGRRVELSETHRSLQVQQAYYAQGRQPIAEINRLRKLAGLYLVGPVEAARKVTWVKPGYSKHGTLPAEAFDVKMLNRVTGNADWSEAPFKLFAGFVQRAAAKYGIRISQGAYWSKPDFPHTELID